MKKMHEEIELERKKAEEEFEKKKQEVLRQREELAKKGFESSGRLLESAWIYFFHFRSCKRNGTIGKLGESAHISEL
jgi:hypothetical protein